MWVKQISCHDGLAVSEPVSIEHRRCTVVLNIIHWHSHLATAAEGTVSLPTCEKTEEGDPGTVVHSVSVLDPFPASGLDLEA